MLKTVDEVSVRLDWSVRFQTDQFAPRTDQFARQTDQFGSVKIDQYSTVKVNTVL